MKFNHLVKYNGQYYPAGADGWAEGKSGAVAGAAGDIKANRP